MTNDIDKWSINESLLQSYRSIFISSQAFLLVVGAIVAGKNGIVLFSVAAISLLMIWVIWFPIVRSRHRIVDYYKFSTRLSEANRSQLCSEHDYVHDRKLRTNANHLLGIQTNWRETRWKIDFLLPVCFSVIWIVLVIYEIWAA